MSFADKQTLEDLNILGKYKQNSVFSLFNQVHTGGGEKLLQAMFQQPLTDADEINKRSALFRYFEGSSLRFPFGNEDFSITENYLSGSGPANYLASVTDLTKKKITANLVRDEEYAAIETGLLLTITVLKDLQQFLTVFDDDINSPYHKQLTSLKNIFNNKKLQQLISETSIVKLPLLKMARYDHLLRTELRPEMVTITAAVYELDVYLAVAGVAKAKEFSYATAQPKTNNVFNAAALSHPGINKAVANPVSLHQDENLIFLTGANMAGKSTFMKAFGINVYLAHMGFPVAATGMTFSVKDGIYSSINVADDLNMGYSHFYAEVLRVKTVAQEVAHPKNLVVIFDELFKGTNVKDAYDATLAVTAAFAAYRNCLFIISTHIVEVGDALQDQHNNLQFLYLPTTLKGTIPHYTYRLQAGISADRHGMMIIENEGILNMLAE
jgi:DNA mismatch repair protein MutS